MITATQAKCPECKEWSGVIDTMPDFVFAAWAWAANNGSDCPHCGFMVLFESECEFRTREIRDEK